MAAQLWSLCAETAETPPELFPAPRIFITAAGQPKMHYPATACKPPFAMLSSVLIATLCSVLSACGGGNASADLEKTVAAELPSMATSASAADTPSSAPDASLLDASKAEPLVAQMPTQSASDAVGANSKIAAATKTSTVALSIAPSPAMKAAAPPPANIAKVFPTPIPGADLSRTAVVDPTEIQHSNFTLTPKLAPLPAALPPDPTPITTQSSAPVKKTTAPATLEKLATIASYTAASYGATPSCRVGYLTSTAPKLSTSAELPVTGGYAYSKDDLTIWRDRAKTGPFIKANDFTKGSPGDLERIRANAASFDSNGEPLPNASDDWRTRHGTLARDRIFLARLNNDTALPPKVVSYLLEQAKNPRNDFRSLCFVGPIGKEDPPDAYFSEGNWLYRFATSYDFAKPLIGAADRLVIENYLLQQAHFFATHADWYLALLFPSRNSGNYAIQARYAVKTTVDDSNYFSGPLDTNGDCKVDEIESKKNIPIFAYITSTGKSGPRISSVSRIYNNRRAATMAAVGHIGLILNEPQLINRAKRYHMEWLTYSVYPDGAQGEYERNGDYCIAKQGVIYANVNTQTALHFALRLQRQGDNDLVNFSTTNGLFGTEAASGTNKSLALAVGTAINLANQKLDWFMSEPWKASQTPRPATHLGRLDNNFMNGPSSLDAFNELGLLLGSQAFPSLNIQGFLLRDKSVTSIRFPGATGNSVGTGSGSWTDALNSMPAILFIRP